MVKIVTQQPIIQERQGDMLIYYTLFVDLQPRFTHILSMSNQHYMQSTNLVALFFQKSRAIFSTYSVALFFVKIVSTYSVDYKVSTYSRNDHPLGLFFLHIVLTTYSNEYILVELTVPWDSSANRWERQQCTLRETKSDETGICIRSSCRYNSDQFQTNLATCDNLMFFFII